MSDFQPFDKCFIGGSDEGAADHMFSGQLSTMYLFSEALSSAQIASIYELGPSYKVSGIHLTLKYLRWTKGW